MKKQTITVLCFTILLVGKSFGQWGNGTMNTLTQTTNGNVGIGTASPASRLVVWDANNTSDESQMIRLGISSIYDYRIFRQRSNGVLRFDATQNTYSGFMFTTPQAPNGLIMLNAGNVGIGTAAPREKLEVNGNVRLGSEGFNDAVVDPNTVLTIYQNGSASGKKGLKFKTYDNNLTLISVENTNFPNKSPFTVNGDGKTFIGTQRVPSRPNSLLTVSGEVDCMSLYVLKPTTWQDRVFENDYKLENLNSVEKYITKHKHLPGIKSEKEILEKGYDVNEIDAVLLEKIENLYLYIIQQQKEIEALKNKINK